MGMATLSPRKGLFVNSFSFGLSYYDIKPYLLGEFTVWERWRHVLHSGKMYQI